MFKSKIVVGITLFVFFVINTSILTAGLLINDKKVKPKTADQRLLGVTDNSTEQTVLSREIVTLHNTKNDCWIIIDNGVYSVSSFLTSHPGGANEIIRYCGQDASNAFATKGKIPGLIHSAVAKKMLNNYLVGKIGDIINAVKRDPSNSDIPTNQIILPSNSIPTGTSPVNTNSIILSASEVAKHSTGSDCWMIVTGLVYDLSGYVSQHPGGSVMVPYCGKDGTVAFQTQGGKGSHSSTASNILASRLLGPLNSTATTQPSSGPAGTTTTGTTNPTTVSTTNTNSTGSLPTAITSKYPNAIYISGKFEDDGVWEGKINVSGVCKAVKVSTSGSIKEENC